jgi:3-hydroxyisobutyrate dehydrogenase
MNTISPKTTRIGWIGTGVMGRAMCAHLVEAGYAVTLTTRTKTKAQELLDGGAIWADTPRKVAAAADVVISIVGFPSDVREVMLGSDGALAGSKPGNVLVDMTTSQPGLAAEIAEQAAARKIVGIDAPVSGGDVGARNATLSIMIGGDAEAVARLEPIWKSLGAKWVRQGGPGAGQHTKIVNQTLIATGMIGVCEALLYGYKAGLDLEKVMESVASGAAGSWSLSNLGPRIVANNFDPGFFVSHFIKDMSIALGESRRMNLALPGLALAEQLYQSVAAQGHARLGTHSLILALAQMSNIDWVARNGNTGKQPPPS